MVNKIDNQLGGYRWTICSDHFNTTFVPHTEADVHSIGLELLPAFRSRGLFELFRKHFLVTLKKEGFKKLYSETYLYNKRAVKAHLKIGVSKIGIATRFSIFGKNVVIWHDMTSKANFL